MKTVEMRQIRQEYDIADVTAIIQQESDLCEDNELEIALNENYWDLIQSCNNTPSRETNISLCSLLDTIRESHFEVVYLRKDSSMYGDNYDPNPVRLKITKDTKAPGVKIILE